MKVELKRLIEEFRRAQDRAVAQLTEWGIKQPKSGLDWACSRHRYFSRDGIKFRPHGRGCELTFTNMAIDFDWGDQGQPDGFDAWRLHNFGKANGIGVYDDEVIKGWLEESVQLGKLFKQGSLYYEVK